MSTATRSHTAAADSSSELTDDANPLPYNLYSGRSRLARVTGVQILGTGAFAPHDVVHNDDLSEHGFDSDWIVQRTGIHERRKAHHEFATSDLAYEAAIRCLDNAKVDPRDVDLVLVATMTPDSPMPTTACLLQGRLGCTAPALDINAACTGFVYALVTGMQFVSTGCSQRVLVVGGDLMSRAVNPADKKTYPLFGDGGGAVLLGPGTKEQGLTSFTLGSEGDRGGLLCQPGGGTREPLSLDNLDAGRQFIQMDGRAVFKWAVRVVHDATMDVIRHAEMTVEDIDLAVLHQANIRIIEAAVDDLGIAREKVIVNLDRYGNTAAGSMPLVLDEANRGGRIRRGDRVLLCGFGGGLAWGAGIMTW